MNWKYLHIIRIYLLCSLLGFASCHNESFQPTNLEDSEKPDENSLFLAFRTGIAGISTRADDMVAANDAAIRQLRVVITSSEDGASNWVVEENRVINAQSVGIPLSDEYVFKVKAGCKKRIYLLANCAGLKDADGNPLDFTDGAFIPEDSPAGTDKHPRVNSYVFDLFGEKGYSTAIPDGGIPMTAVHEIAIPDIETIRKDAHYKKNIYHIGSLYVVRTINKAAFNFIHKGSSRNIKIRQLRIAHIANNRTYLMPHVNKNSTGSFWVVDTDRKQTVSLGNKHWIDWMADEAEKEEEVATYQWLTDYEIPLEQQEHIPFSYEWPGEPLPTLTASSKTPQIVFYLPESRYLQTTDGTDRLKLQEYTLTVTTSEAINGFTEEKTYEGKLPYLSSLFRNTHVQIEVTFKDNDMQVEVALVPYAEVALEPDFGLDGILQRLIPIYDENRAEIICYYDAEAGKYYHCNPDTGELTETINPFWAIDAGTGYVIIRDDQGEIKGYYDKINGIYYGPDKVTVIPDPYH